MTERRPKKVHDMASTTEIVIRNQFPLWRAALGEAMPRLSARVIVLTGCGTSYYLAQALAAAYTAAGQQAVAVPGAEWARRPENYLADCKDSLVVGLSRSGTTTETVQAVAASRAKGWDTFAISCEPGSTILTAAARGLCLKTDAAEGIVMSASASLMLLAGLRLAGIAVPASVVAAAEHGLAAMDAGVAGVLPGRSHFVYLGAGVNYGIATEGSLKLLWLQPEGKRAMTAQEFLSGRKLVVGSTPFT